MIARASMGQPWLFAELLAHYQQQPFVKPTADRIGEVFINHVERLATLDSERRAVLEARKMGKYYSRNAIPSSQEFNRQLIQCITFDEFKSLVQQHFMAST
jgi:tRNA-dihydrouridine synthase B